MASITHLPDEILLEIFSNLDYATLQKKCTSVCKKWKGIIRNEEKISNTLKLKYPGLIYPGLELPYLLTEKEFYLLNNIQSSWPKLKTLTCSKELAFLIDFSQFTSLQNLYLNQCEFTPFKGFKVNTMYFDPMKWNKDIEEGNFQHYLAVTLIIGVRGLETTV